MAIPRFGLIGRTYRHVDRYRQILTVLFRYGFGDLINGLKIEQYIEAGLQLIVPSRREKLESLSRAERVRMALEELGSTFIKMGQILSTRPDLIPIDFVHELEKLQRSVPPFPFAEVREIVEAELDHPLAEVFGRFDEQCKNDF